jgi:hypothetical protein
MVQTRELGLSDLEQATGGSVASGFAAGFAQGAASGVGPSFPIGPTTGGARAFLPAIRTTTG